MLLFAACIRLYKKPPIKDKRVEISFGFDSNASFSHDIKLVPFNQSVFLTTLVSTCEPRLVPKTSLIC